MSLVLPALAAAAQSGLRDIKGILPPPGLPPFAVSALMALTVVGAGAFSAASKKWGRGDFQRPDRAEPLERLLQLCDAYCEGTLPQPLLFDRLWEELRSIGLTEGSPTADQAVPAAGDVAPEEPLALLRSLLITCDAVRYGNQTLARDQVVTALNHAVAVVTAWGGRGL